MSVLPRTEIATLLNDYLTRAEAALIPTPSRIEITPGRDPAWDDCCSGSGQLYLRVIEMTPISINTGTGRRSAAGVQCDISAWVFRLAIGVIRCAHTVNDDGEPPTSTEVTADAAQMLADANAILTVLENHEHTRDISRWLPQGPQGGCHGGEWEFDVRMDACR